MLFFVVFIVTMAALPGPALLSIFAVGSITKFKDGQQYVIGALIGANLVLFMGFAGVFLAVEISDKLKDLIALIGFCFIVGLALRILSTDVYDTKFVLRNKFRLIDGVLVQTVNPKGYAVAATICSGYEILETNQVLDALIKLGLINLIWVPAYFLWFFVGRKASKRLQRLVNPKLFKILLSTALLCSVITPLTGSLLNWK